MFSCDWCGKQIERAWQIPKKAGASRPKQYVCKEHHEMWANGNVELNDETGEPVNLDV